MMLFQHWQKPCNWDLWIKIPEINPVILSLDGSSSTSKTKKEIRPKLTTTAHLTVRDQDTICAVISDESHEMLAFQLMHLSLVICRDAQHRGGVLLHGALAGWNGNGVILAGPGGRGKTTASRRLPRQLAVILR